MCFGSNAKMKVEMFLIGLFVFDFVFGVGGLLKGCIIEIYGLEFFGKMMFCLSVIVEV